MDQSYRHSNGSVSRVQYHFVWIPRRRRKVLIGPVADRLEVLLRTKAEELGIQTLSLAIQPDHVHWFVNAPPSIAPSQIMYRVKGATARELRKEFPQLRKMPSMWTTAYFCATVGAVSERVIQRYIDAQSTRS